MKKMLFFAAAVMFMASQLCSAAILPQDIVAPKGLPPIGKWMFTEELTPEAHRGPHSHFATMATMVGFAVMMILDVALG